VKAVLSENYVSIGRCMVQLQESHF